jgi:glycosyltransferase involved in cell wall biosynthesis
MIDVAVNATSKVTGGAAETVGTGQQRPAVSIVVPCYNGGRFLDALMASLARQTFRDFEVVLVDDGSTDDETRQKLAALSDRVHLIRQENCGPSAARNAGARAARSDILFMLDCDDTVEPSFLADTVPLLQKAPAGIGMVVTYLRLVGAESGIVSRYFNRFDLLFTNTLSAGLVMRKSAFVAAGGYDETMREGYEDWDFSLRMASAGFGCIAIKKPLYIYTIAGQDTQPSRSSGVDTKRLYGPLWRAIRKRHPDLYRPWAMVRLWAVSRDGSGRLPLWKGLTACALASALPDALFNTLVARLHRGARADNPTPAHGEAAAGAVTQP